MQAFAEQHDIMSTPRRTLIGSYKGNKILLGKPLLKFYLYQGLLSTLGLQVMFSSCSCCSSVSGVNALIKKMLGDD